MFVWSPKVSYRLILVHKWTYKDITDKFFCLSSFQENREYVKMAHITPVTPIIRHRETGKIKCKCEKKISSLICRIQVSCDLCLGERNDGGPAQQFTGRRREDTSCLVSVLYTRLQTRQHYKLYQLLVRWVCIQRSHAQVSCYVIAQVISMMNGVVQ